MQGCCLTCEYQIARDLAKQKNIPVDMLVSIYTYALITER